MWSCLQVSGWELHSFNIKEFSVSLSSARSSCLFPLLRGVFESAWKWWNLHAICHSTLPIQMTATDLFAEEALKISISSRWFWHFNGINSCACSIYSNRNDFPCHARWRKKRLIIAKLQSGKCSAVCPGKEAHESTSSLTIYKQPVSQVQIEFSL